MHQELVVLYRLFLLPRSLFGESVLQRLKMSWLKRMYRSVAVQYVKISLHSSLIVCEHNTHLAVCGPLSCRAGEYYSATLCGGNDSGCRGRLLSPLQAAVKITVHPQRDLTLFASSFNVCF